MMTKEDFMTQYNKSDAQKAQKKKLKAVLMKNILRAKHALKIAVIKAWLFYTKQIMTVNDHVLVQS